jgi:hypothetical protein
MRATVLHCIRGLVALLALGWVAVLSAQSGRSYGPGRVWWEAGEDGVLPWEESYDNPDGQVGILNRKGAVHTRDHPFFTPLGPNGRACVTCHQPANAMSVSTAALRERWNETQGKDPVFAAVDGSNCPDQAQAEMRSHSLLLDRGLFRIPLPWPPKDSAGRRIQPEFRIEVVRDPTGCNTSPVYGLAGANPSISVYRRPRIAANLDSLVAGPEGVNFMSDAREATLRGQAISAAMGHEQADSPPTAEQLRQIVEFESQVYAAQSSDIRGGLLNEKDGPAILGPGNLATGKAGSLGAARSAALLFDVWRKPEGAGDLGFQFEFRASVARGSNLFFNGCATCHSPGTTRWMDIGTTNQPPATASPELPLFRVTCDATGRVIYTQDPGRALISGKCADVGAIVLQQLRGLAARAPYFSNGSARSLREVVDFYDRRFGIGYTEREKQDLLNFLRVL